MLTNTARAVALDALDLDFIGAHDGFPGHTGANEIATPRGNATFDAASGTPPTRELNAPVLIDIPGGETVRWLVAWTASGSPDDPLAVSPNGGDPAEFEVDLTNNKILDHDNAMADADKVVFYNGTPPAPLVEGTVYFVRDRDADGFKVAATAGGSAIDLTALHTTSVVYSPIVEEAFAADGQLNVATFVAGLNF